MPRLAVCIPTYRRPHLLAALLGDLLSQAQVPEVLIVVDGSPEHSEVPALLARLGPGPGQIIYLPSSQANLPFQRYLGWRASSELLSDAAEVLLYLDDDLRISQQGSTERLCHPFGISLPEQSPEVVGVSCVLRMGDAPAGTPTGRLLDQRRSLPGFLKRLARRAWARKGYQPGDITPVGHRVPPERAWQPDPDYLQVRWLHGGVMAYRTSTLDESCFSEDLFALDHDGCGLGEDTFLSRRVGRRGLLLQASTVVIDHPNLDPPMAYPYQGARFGRAVAYSRRFLNDHYRVVEPPRPADRVALLRCYAASNLMNLWRVLTQPSTPRLSYAIGFLRGSLRGLLVRPTARALSPKIRWQEEARLSLERAREIS